ncbi:carbohydrate-binding family 9-like protein [Flagellimonas olearia]|uniref:Carbohydrate-binding domain-containing protein n=1 Tax=Flagellimonas olearia TaxID=552546 RepID=A0A444VHT6_9FLAO|nr:carbohydrate-binding family 9-like protein [Allomuricauda olearia]RYC50331.1 hypothetical protein DN53_05240 [Allomuricauda olearia]
MKNAKPIALLFCSLLYLSCNQKKKEEKSTVPTETTQTMTENKTEELPTLTINKESFTELGDLHFKHSVGGEPIEEETLVMVKYDDEFLEIKFECRDNPRMDQNHFTEDNTPMFTQEVFELFISKGKEPMEDYVEIQLNPNNAMFLATIHNNFKGDGKFSSEHLDPNAMGVEHSASKDQSTNTWSGHMKLPLKLLQYPENTPDNVYRLNFYRIISQEDHTEKDWRNNAENSTFACWSSTMAKRPAFHRPEYFGYMVLE